MSGPSPRAARTKCQSQQSVLMPVASGRPDGGRGVVTGCRGGQRGAWRRGAMPISIRAGSSWPSSSWPGATASTPPGAGSSFAAETLRRAQRRPAGSARPDAQARQEPLHLLVAAAPGEAVDARAHGAGARAPLTASGGKQLRWLSLQTGRGDGHAPGCRIVVAAMTRSPHDCYALVSAGQFNQTIISRRFAARGDRC